jgi:hypothetical protein
MFDYVRDEIKREVAKERREDKEKTDETPDRQTVLMLVRPLDLDLPRLSLSLSPYSLSGLDLDDSLIRSLRLSIVI